MIFLILKLSDEKKPVPKHQPMVMKVLSEISEPSPPVKDVVMETAPPPSAAVKFDGAAAGEEHHASMDETWMAIMQKRMVMDQGRISQSEASMRGDEHDGSRDHERDEDEDHEEMNRHFEAFIKKVNDQMRLQSEKSYSPLKQTMVING